MTTQSSPAASAAMLPCPFCGGVLKYFPAGEYHGKEHEGWWSHPTWPDIAMGVAAVRCPAYAWRAWTSETERLAAWNHRAMLAARPICASTQNDETPHASHTTSPPADRWNEAIEAAAKVAEEMPNVILQFWDRPGGPPGNGYRATTGKDIAANIRRLATPPVERADGWQPIETAPKDGTHVIVGTFPEPAGQITTTVAHWFDSRDFGAKSGGAGWALSVNYDGEHSDHGVQAPTHWRPRPAPPQTGNGR